MYYELGAGHTQIERIIADSGTELGVVGRGKKGIHNLLMPAGTAEPLRISLSEAVAYPM